MTLWVGCARRRLRNVGNDLGQVYGWIVPRKSDFENIALAGGWSDRSLTEGDRHRGERCRRCVRPLPLEDRKLKSRQNGEAAFHAENAKSGDNRARRKRRDRETS